MLDLAGLPRGAFAGALQYNLERLQALPKVYDHFLRAAAAHLQADAAWLVRTLRENGEVRESFQHGSPRNREPELIASFVRREKPELPRNVLLAPVQVNGRIEGVVGVERHGREFDRGLGWALNRLAGILATRPHPQGRRAPRPRPRQHQGEGHLRAPPAGSGISDPRRTSPAPSLRPLRRAPYL